MQDAGHLLTGQQRVVRLQQHLDLGAPGQPPGLVQGSRRPAGHTPRAPLGRDADDAGVRPSVDNVFVKLDSPDFGPAQLDRIGAAGLRPMITLEPWSWRSRWGDAALPDYALSTIVAGRHDAELSRIARTTAAYGRPVLLRFAHEMNGWWYPWAAGVNGNTAADYVAAWRHVRSLFWEAGATDAAFVWSPNALTGSGRETPMDQLYPGDAWVDLVGMTAYSHGAAPDATYDPTYAALTALTGKDIVLSETGYAGAGKADWIAGFGGWIAGHPRVSGFVWFNLTPASAGLEADYRFNDGPGSTDAFRSMLRGLRLSR